MSRLFGKPSALPHKHGAATAQAWFRARGVEPPCQKWRETSSAKFREKRVFAESRLAQSAGTYAYSQR